MFVLLFVGATLFVFVFVFVFEFVCYAGERVETVVGSSGQLPPAELITPP